MLWSFFIFIVSISILVTVHEFGHFFAARLCGVKVTTFSIGFGKELLSYQGKETQFKLSLIPLGGYVKMVDSRFDSIEPQDLKRAFDHKSSLKRVFILIAGPSANFILAFLLYWIISMIGISALKPTIQNIINDSPAFLAEFEPNQTIAKINNKKMQDWRQINQYIGQALNSNTEIKFDFVTQNNEPALTKTLKPPYSLKKSNQSAIEKIGIVPEKLIVYPVIDQIITDSAAQNAELQLDDRFVSYKTYQNQVPIVLNPKLSSKEWNEFVQVIQNSPIIFLEIERDGAFFWKKIELSSQKNKETSYYSLGILPKNNAIIIKYSILEGFIYAVNVSAQTFSVIIDSFYQLLVGKIGLESLSGPISIAQAATAASEYGLVSFLGFIAFISLSLGIVNLIPLPALDGGQVLLLGVEKLKGAPLSHSFQMRFFRVGIGILITIMGIALFNDFSRI